MYTGLIQGVGRVSSIESTDSGARILLDKGQWTHTPTRGDSISLNGCCLTVAVDPGPGGELAFDAIPETLRMTTLGDLSEGSAINLEHSARADTFMGGHIVQGHIDGVGEVIRVTDSEEYRVRIRPPSDLMKFITPKGSVAVDGISLTVAAVDVEGDWFEVALIPTTLADTNLDEAKPGSRVNLETDILARTVVHYIEHYAKG